MEILGALTFLNTYTLAELEVGEHFLWKIGNFTVHGQVFLNSWIVIGLLVIASLAATRNIQKIPSGIQNFMEFVLEFIRDLVRNQIGEKEYRDWVPFNGTLVLFIFVSN